MMMIGAFITLTMVNEEWWGLPFGIGVILAIGIMAGLSYLLEVIVIRKLFGQPQFAVVILTIALWALSCGSSRASSGATIRTVAGNPVRRQGLRHRRLDTRAMMRLW